MEAKDGRQERKITTINKIKRRSKGGQDLHVKHQTRTHEQQNETHQSTKIWYWHSTILGAGVVVQLETGGKQKEQDKWKRGREEVVQKPWRWNHHGYVVQWTTMGSCNGEPQNAQRTCGNQEEGGKDCQGERTEEERGGGGLKASVMMVWFPVR